MDFFDTYSTNSCKIKVNIISPPTRFLVVFLFSSALKQKKTFNSAFPWSEFYFKFLQYFTLYTETKLFHKTKNY